MKNKKNSKINLLVFLILAGSMTLINNSCKKPLADFFIEITNPFDFDVYLRRSFGIDIDDCKGEGGISECILKAKEVKTFMAEEPTATISVEFTRYQTDRQWVHTDDVGKLNFGAKPGESYKWNVGFGTPLYDKKGNIVMDHDTGSNTGGNNGGGNNGNGNGGNTKGNGQVVFYSQANIDECKEVEVVVFRSLEEYFGTVSNPKTGRGVLGKKTFTGVFPNQEATCNSSNAAVFSLPEGKYFVQHEVKNCKFGFKKHAWFEFTVVKDQCTKIRLTR